ncbi:MAG: DUF305 domain-containing protein [Chroococcidiopsidaceae cyanobacterium CP_BM_RX_35]|nr:DUF305 domain-containing protein [Chroococcidiopsidaceae cyanobacterium CP_BM_RX_35]
MNSLLRNGVLVAFFSLMAAVSLSPGWKATKQANAKIVSAFPIGDKQMPNHDNMGDMGSGMRTMVDLGPADAKYDLRFIDAMIPHHQGAVEMATDALSKSQRPEIKRLAQYIITDQNQEIAQLKQWRQAWYPKAGTTAMVYDSQMGNTMAMSPAQMQDMMMKGNLGPANAQYDLRFMNAMIPHHQGAVAMAQDALNKSRRPEIKSLAQRIITAQQREIAQMQQWRQQWYQQ